jgi:hypothetical protein
LVAAASYAGLGHYAAQNSESGLFSLYQGIVTQSLGSTYSFLETTRSTIILTDGRLATLILVVTSQANGKPPQVC